MENFDRKILFAQRETSYMENCSRTYKVYVIFTEIKIESERWNWNILSRIIELVLFLTIRQNLRIILFEIYFIIFIEDRTIVNIETQL